MQIVCVKNNLQSDTYNKLLRDYDGLGDNGKSSECV